MIDVTRPRIRVANALLAALGVAWGSAGPASACTTVMVGRLATRRRFRADGQFL